MENFTDQQLINLYIQGNQRAFDGLINRYGQTIYRFSLNLVNNSDLAKDITQETFIKVWKNIKKYDINKNFKSWMFTIAKRTAIDYLRKKKSVVFSSLETDDIDEPFEQNIPDEELLANELFEKNENIVLIQEALKILSTENKIIVLLHNGEEMAFDQISEIIDKPMNTIKSQYRRSLIKLKEHIEKQMHQNRV